MIPVLIPSTIESVTLSPYSKALGAFVEVDGHKNSPLVPRSQPCLRSRAISSTNPMSGWSAFLAQASILPGLMGLFRCLPSSQVSRGQCCHQLTGAAPEYSSRRGTSGCFCMNTFLNGGSTFGLAMCFLRLARSLSFLALTRPEKLIIKTSH